MLCNGLLPWFHIYVAHKRHRLLRRIPQSQEPVFHVMNKNHDYNTCIYLTQINLTECKTLRPNL